MGKNSIIYEMQTYDIYQTKEEDIKSIMCETLCNIASGDETFQTFDDFSTFSNNHRSVS